VRSRKSGSLAIFALAAIGTAVLTGSRVIAVEAAYPVEHAGRCFSQKVWARVTGFFRASAANAENVRLRREVASLAMLRGDVERLESENARLRRALDYVAKAPEVWVAAGVLSRGGGAVSTRKSIRVDKGSLAGVKEGAIVLVPEGLVGRVVAVTPHTSEVLLVTDSSLKVACEVESPTGRMSGVLAGGDDDKLRLRYLMGAGETAARSRVLTSGRGGVFPRGIEIGTLLGIRNGSEGLSREGEVLPHVEYSTLEDVFIRREK